MKQDMDYRFANENIPKLILSLSAPAIAAQVINALYNVVDRMYIGRMPGNGRVALTGVGLAFPIIMVISAFAALVGYGGAPLASIKMGEGRRDKAEELMGNCFTMLVGVAVLLTVVLMIFKTPLLNLFGASPDTLPYADSYLEIYLIGTISVQIALGMNQFVSAQGFAKTAMLTVCIGAALNIVLDPIFIFALDMGVRGAALATILSQTVSAVWVLLFISSKRSNLRLRARNFRVSPKVAGPVLALGLSPFIMQSTESLVQVTFNSSLQNYGGDAYVGAMVIMSSVMQFFMMPIMGLAQGSQPIISFNYGAGNHGRVKQAIKYMTAFCVTFGMLLWIIMVFFPQLPIRIFTGDPAVIALTSRLMRIFFLGMVVFGFQMSFQQVFIALGQAKVSIFIAMLRKLILLIPLVLILPHFITPQTTGVIIAEPIADITAALTCCALFAWKCRRLLNGAPETPPQEQ